MRTVKRGVGALSATLLVAAMSCTKPVPTNVSHALTVPLCTIVEKAADYDGKRVTVYGCVTTDGHEYVVLSDHDRPCPNGGLVPIEAPALRPEQRYEPEPGKKVCGTFIGTFRASTTLYKRVLEVEETSGLTTSP